MQNVQNVLGFLNLLTVLLWLPIQRTNQSKPSTRIL